MVMCGFVASTGSEIVPEEKITQEFAKIVHRGPDSTVMKKLHRPSSMMLFHRLAIMGPGQAGDQPLETPRGTVVCNGEIYNYPALKKHCSHHSFRGNSDCEVILPLFETWGIEKLCRNLDGEFALVVYDKENDEFLAARDAVGIRPLFYGTDSSGQYFFASEAKAIHELCTQVLPFPPGHYWSESRGFVPYKNVTHKPVTGRGQVTGEENALAGINELLTAAVAKRLQSDAPIGFLLSGGLDSSLICAIASDLLPRPVTTFAVGIDENPIDAKYAREVADFIGSDHREYLFSFEDVLEALPRVIYHLETYDITTVRASIGMYLLCRHIKQTTDIKVLLTGEVSDELFGYKYTDFAPSPQAFQEEAVRRVEELHLYDVLRCDRCISAHSLEARVPFGDHDFASFVFNIHPQLKMNREGVGKALLRKAFIRDGLLPYHILYREKAAFSDAVGHAMVDRLKAHAEKKYSKAQLMEAKLRFPHCPPSTPEALLYREIFEEFFPGRAASWLPQFWMPNREWEHCDVDDPSARALPNYGTSGA